MLTLTTPREMFIYYNIKTNNTILHKLLVKWWFIVKLWTCKILININKKEQIIKQTHTHTHTHINTSIFP